MNSIKEFLDEIACVESIISSLQTRGLSNFPVDTGQFDAEALKAYKERLKIQLTSYIESKISC